MIRTRATELPPVQGATGCHDLFIDQYLREFNDVMGQVSQDEINAASKALLAAFVRGAWVFVAGNGGSASLASHLACDLEKTVSGKDPRSAKKRFRVQSLVDNIARLTAWANDETYDCVFSEPLHNQASPNDVLVVVSASGNSPNVVAALATAREHDMVTIGVLGFDGGRAQPMCDYPILVPSRDYGIVEGAHGVITHLLTSWLTRAVDTMRHLEVPRLTLATLEKP
jgi:D-sedoheptulose 7-phosphate isomerase